MLTLITGSPGAGKTLYAVSRLLPDILKTELKDAQGSVINRTLYTNINGLLLDHEKIDAGPDGLSGWSNWCKPGDYIVYDEVQHHWPVRPNGSKVPSEIGALETHRHQGVDLILITQHPMLIDQNVRALIGRHIHIRGVGQKMAIVYEWDHCSRQLLYSKAMSKKMFRHKKADYAVYKSSELHTKNKPSLPAAAFIAIPAIAIAAFTVPNVYNSIVSKGQPAAGSNSTAAKVVTPPGQIMVSGVPFLPTKAPPRANPESENMDTQRPDLSDLILTGHIYSPGQNIANFQWVQNGLPKYNFTLAQLGSLPFRISFVSHCHVRIMDTISLLARDYWCQPGLVAPDLDKPRLQAKDTGGTAPAASSTAKALSVF